MIEAKESVIKTDVSIERFIENKKIKDNTINIEGIIEKSIKNK